MAATPDGRYNGSDILISVDGQLLALQKSASRSSTRETIDLSAKGDTSAVIIPGRLQAGTLQLSAMFVTGASAYQTLLAAHRDGSLVDVTITVDGDPYEEGQCYVSQIDEDWPEEAGATISATLTNSAGWAPPSDDDS